MSRSSWGEEKKPYHAFTIQNMPQIIKWPGCLTVFLDKLGIVPVLPCPGPGAQGPPGFHLLYPCSGKGVLWDQSDKSLQVPRNCLPLTSLSLVVQCTLSLLATHLTPLSTSRHDKACKILLAHPDQC